MVSMIRLALSAPLALVVACATAQPGGGGDDDPDARRSADARPGADGSNLGQPDGPVTPTPDAAPTMVTLSQSTATTVTALNSVACSANQAGAILYTRDNSFYRVFNLNQLGVTGAFRALRVDFGVETADALDGSQPVQIRLHTLSGVLNTANLNLIYAENVNLNNTTNQVVPVTFASPPTIPAGSVLVAEISSPDGMALEDIFFPGSNTGGESAPSYVRSTACNISQPVTTGSLGFANMHLVLSVTGQRL